MDSVQYAVQMSNKQSCQTRQVKFELNMNMNEKLRKYAKLLFQEFVSRIWHPPDRISDKSHHPVRLDPKIIFTNTVTLSYNKLPNLRKIAIDECFFSLFILL